MLADQPVEGQQVAVHADAWAVPLVQQLLQLHLELLDVPRAVEGRPQGRALQSLRPPHPMDLGDTNCSNACNRIAGKSGNKIVGQLHWGKIMGG
jgi:hypothetical protein